LLGGREMQIRRLAFVKYGIFN